MNHAVPNSRTSLREIDQGDRTEVPQSIRMVVMKMSRDDCDRQTCQRRKSWVNIARGRPGIDQQRTVLSDQQVFEVVRLVLWLTDRVRVRCDLLLQPEPVDDPSGCWASQWFDGYGLRRP